MNSTSLKCNGRQSLFGMVANKVRDSESDRLKSIQDAPPQPLKPTSPSSRFGPTEYFLQNMHVNKKPRTEGAAAETEPNTAASTTTPFSALATKYGLLPVPESWLAGPTGSSITQLASDESKWALYVKQRADDLKPQKEKGRLRKVLVKNSRKILAADASLDPSFREKMIDATRIYVDVEDDGDDSIRDAGVSVRVWSPFALPTGIELQVSYHSRTRYYSVEWFFHVEWRLLPLKDTTPAITGRDRSFRTLFRAGFLEAPSLNDDEADYQNSSTVEDLDSSGWSLAVFNEMRTALFGPSSRSRELISDRTLAEFLLSAAGAIGDTELECGHSWSPLEGSEIAQAQMKEEGIDPDAAKSIGWIEHETRKALGCPVPLDRYYKPYDIDEAKTEWGERVLDYFEEQREMEDESDEDEEEEEDENGLDDDELRHFDGKWWKLRPDQVWKAAEMYTGTGGRRDDVDDFAALLARFTATR